MFVFGAARNTPKHGHRADRRSVESTLNSTGALDARTDRRAKAQVCVDESARAFRVEQTFLTLTDPFISAPQLACISLRGATLDKHRPENWR